MRVRLGYVAIALKLPKVTSSSHLTYTRYKKMFSEEEKINALKKVTRSNMEDLYKILLYNAENNIHFYRITSKLIPLATHPEVTNWKYKTYFKEDFKRLGELIKKNNMRVDTHPDHFNVLNSLRNDVVEKTKKELVLHDYLFDAMDYPEGKMVLHIGSGQCGKEKSINRFIENFHTLPSKIRSRLILENDDKLFTAKEVLSVCKNIKIPMVLDIHHHLCNNENTLIESILPKFFQTWKGEFFPPKVHISSPKEGEKDRKHADYILPNTFIRFLEKCNGYHQDLDVMIEAKQKDLALYQLAKDIQTLRPDWKWIDTTTIEIK
ncbi:UV DNA damage repair endonuclease UvsE [Marinisporobacter balticus]|uniref:UV-damage endonuclease n=1 Tax=Marinisporobacter balticus TaxID=2018667 RepID=A0A4R2KPD3_9FIRM|nr:UV DNA damage repair endonuclease UvsE [Marinisporobacter balticus]TCO74612.1 UV-damage endonuclease [Marinisporobacter balticus]